MLISLDKSSQITSGKFLQKFVLTIDLMENGLESLFKGSGEENELLCDPDSGLYDFCRCTAVSCKNVCKNFCYVC